MLCRYVWGSPSAVPLGLDFFLAPPQDGSHRGHGPGKCSVDCRPGLFSVLREKEVKM